MYFQNVFSRYEIKYVIDRRQRRLIEATASEHMRPDVHGRSIICNLYFDTPDKRLARRSIERPVFKEKMRLRSYGLVKADGIVFVELKRKYKDVVYKRRAPMTLGDAVGYLRDNKPIARPTQVTGEIDYFRLANPGLAPITFISYERTAFCARGDSGFRMTLDENILWREEDLSLESGVYGTRLLDPDQVVLECKCAGALPLWLTTVLSENRIYKTSFSKYGNAYKAMLQENNMDSKEPVFMNSSGASLAIYDRHEIAAGYHARD